MNYRLLLLILIANNASLVGKCACHETQQIGVQSAIVHSPVAVVAAPTVVQDPVATTAISDPPAVIEPVVVPNTHVEPSAPEKEMVIETAYAQELSSEVEKTDDLRTTVQRAAVLCAAIGVVCFILYKAASNSPLERAVSGLERKANLR